VGRYEDLTLKEKARICNGCGGKGGFITPPHADLFKEECNNHDYDYHVGGSLWDKIKADFKLRLNMRQKIKTESITSLRAHLYFNNALLPDWMIRQIYHRWADAYCMGVVIAGGRYFNFDTT
jgi:hypothetical protein